MDQSAGNEADYLCKKGIQQLTKSLASLRKAESSDVILVCQDQEFFAHKLILQVNSLYFQTLFNSGKSDFQNDRVVFKDIEPQTMDAILDFMYLRRVDKIRTPDKVEKVAKVASMMGLGELFEVCCILSKVAVDQDVRKPNLNKKAVNIHTAPADVSTAKNFDLSRDTSYCPLDPSSDLSRGSRFENMMPFQISDLSNSRRYEKWKRLVVKLLKNPLTLSDTETRQLDSQRPRSLRRFYCGLLSFLVVLALYSIVLLQMIQHLKVPNDFTTDLFHCLKSEPENHHGCINAMFKRYQSTNSFRNVFLIGTPGNGLLRFTFDEKNRLENALLGAALQFSWKLTYYSDYGNYLSEHFAFCPPWLGIFNIQICIVFLLIVWIFWTI